MQSAFSYVHDRDALGADEAFEEVIQQAHRAGPSKSKMRSRRMEHERFDLIIIGHLYDTAEKLLIATAATVASSRSGRSKCRCGERWPKCIGTPRGHSILKFPAMGLRLLFRPARRAPVRRFLGCGSLHSSGRGLRESCRADALVFRAAGVRETLKDRQRVGRNALAFFLAKLLEIYQPTSLPVTFMQPTLHTATPPA
jgi:hypothetical protein